MFARHRTFHLTELHGGTFDLQSTEGEGTTAFIRLPGERIIDHESAAGMDAIAGTGTN
jgi:hypothetical protein